MSIESALRKVTAKDLTYLTLTTCLIGGTFWLGRSVSILREEYKSKGEQSYNTILDICDSLSIKVALSAFYSYLALNVNKTLLAANICTVEILTVGYLSVLGGLGVEMGYKIVKYVNQNLGYFDKNSERKDE